MSSEVTANLTGEAPLALFLDRSCRRDRGCWDDTTDGLTLVSALRFESGDLSGNYRKLRITSERIEVPMPLSSNQIETYWREGYLVVKGLSLKNSWIPSVAGLRTS